MIDWRRQLAVLRDQRSRLYGARPICYNSLMLAHMVYFSLKDPTPDNRRKMLAACDKYLTGHPGQVFYAAGTCASYDRPVNDRDFDVALQLVFEDRETHDAYQAAPRHKQFIDKCQSMWAQCACSTPMSAARIEASIDRDCGEIRLGGSLALPVLKRRLAHFSGACVACVTAAPARSDVATIAASTISASLAPAFRALLL